MKITPSWISTFETNVQTLSQDAWKRVSANLIWDKFMEVRSSGTGRELYFWLIESAKIVSQGRGGNKRFDDLAATFLEIVNEDSGAGLRLTRNEIEDNMMAAPGLNRMTALNYSANWATQMGGSQGYWPQEKMFELILAGTANTYGLAYDGLVFFHNAHLVDPTKPSGFTYANLLTGAAGSTPATDQNDAIYPGACPIDTSGAATLEIAASNFAAAVAYLQSVKGPNGKPRKLKVVAALAGEPLRKRLSEILDTKYFGTGAGSTENVVSRYGIEPVFSSEITSATDYYLKVEMLDGEGGGLIFQDREGYILSSYAPDTQADLQRRKEFEWAFDGRNAAAYGHPYGLAKAGS